jgi:predicted RNA-binding protein
MCLAKVYLGGSGEEKPLMEEIISIKSEGGKLLIATLFGEQREIEASIKEIDFKSSNVILENAGS